MLARHVRVDVIVVAMIGERGREVNDFIANSLGAAGLARSVVIAATADDPALVRTHAVHAAHAVAEFFRDRGRHVLLILDSMTRFAMAQREVGLAVGEPPTYRGYTPSVFSLMPKLLERCGRLQTGGAITAVYSVLVEGDDMNEPIADHMRAILDGHIVLSRTIAARAHHPAIDVLQSASRLMSAVASKQDRAVASEVLTLLAAFEASRDLVEMGAYQEGSNAILDRALRVLPAVQRLLRQLPDESSARDDALRQLDSALATTDTLA
jgi:flagellum-specific ATP synthase